MVRLVRALTRYGADPDGPDEPGHDAEKIGPCVDFSHHASVKHPGIIPAQ
jgi:hypothetical protein